MPDLSTPPKLPVHAFRRFFARTFDNALAVCVLLFDAQVLWGSERAMAAFEAHRFAFWIPALLLWSIVEAGLLALKGNTPGKWLFGIRVIPQGGEIPRFWSILNRSLNALIFGQGGSVPLVNLYAGIQSYRDLTERGATRWDKGRFTVHASPFGAGGVLLHHSDNRTVGSRRRLFRAVVLTCSVPPAREVAHSVPDGISRRRLAPLGGFGLPPPRAGRRNR